MKIGKLFLAGIVALGFGLTACNNDVPEVQKGAEATVSVQVLPSSKGPVVRLTGDLSGDGILPPGVVAESAIKNVEVWLFVGETPDGYKKGNDGEPFVEGIVSTAGPKSMVVAANANIGAVANKTELLAKIQTPLTQNIDNGLIMTAEPVDVTLAGGYNQYGYKTDDPNYKADATQHSLGVRLPITRINARVALVGLQYEFTDPFYDTFKLTEVAMFNARESSKLFGAPLITPDNKFLYGAAYPTSLNSYVGSPAYAGAYTATVDATLVQAFTPNAALTDPILIQPENAHYFYAFENTADTPENREGTFIVLKGTLWKGDVQFIAPGLATDAEGFTYYAIWVNATAAGTTFEGENTGDGILRRNTQYNIIATLKKAGNPTIDPPVEAQLDVYVEVAPWKVITQNVIWSDSPVTP